MLGQAVRAYAIAAQKAPELTIPNRIRMDQCRLALDRLDRLSRHGVDVNAIPALSTFREELRGMRFF